VYSLLDDGQILRVETVQTEKQLALVGSQFTWSTHLHASLTDGLLRIECRRPMIDGTEWNGQIALDESRPVYMIVDGSEPLEIPILSGVAEVPIVFDLAGTYTLRFFANYGCVTTTLVVTV